jgi:ethanolamine utilization microcompartment shell protein EutS
MDKGKTFPCAVNAYQVKGVAIEQFTRFSGSVVVQGLGPVQEDFQKTVEKLNGCRGLR